MSLARCCFTLCFAFHVIPHMNSDTAADTQKSNDKSCVEDSDKDCVQNNKDCVDKLDDMDLTNNPPPAQTKCAPKSTPKPSKMPAWCATMSSNNKSSSSPSSNSGGTKPAAGNDNSRPNNSISDANTD